MPGNWAYSAAAQALEETELVFVTCTGRNSGILKVAIDPRLHSQLARRCILKLPIYLRALAGKHKAA